MQLMTPTPEVKRAFAAWTTKPVRLTLDHFAAFEIVLTSLKDLLAGRRAEGGGSSEQRRAA